jgi:hypothetical protein
MLKLIDSGCGQHHPRQVSVTGAAAILLGRLLLNLPLTNGGYNYICEHGHTHRLTLLQCKGKVALYPQELGFAGGTASAH